MAATRRYAIKSTWKRKERNVKRFSQIWQGSSDLHFDCGWLFIFPTLISFHATVQRLPLQFLNCRPISIVISLLYLRSLYSFTKIYHQDVITNLKGFSIDGLNKRIPMVIGTTILHYLLYFHNIFLSNNDNYFGGDRLMWVMHMAPLPFNRLGGDFCFAWGSHCSAARHFIFISTMNNIILSFWFYSIIKFICDHNLFRLIISFSSLTK